MPRPPRKNAYLALALLFCLLNGCSSKHPSDQELVDKWRSHRTEFNTLLEMFLADRGLGRVAYDFTRPDNPASLGIMPERLEEYRKLFRMLDLNAGIEGYDEKEIVWLHASTQGLSVTGSKKGYAYCVRPPAVVVENLENYWSKDGRSFKAFRHIEGNWYLYFDYED